MATASIIFDLIGRDRASKDIDRVGNSADKSSNKMAALGKVGKVAALGLAAGAGAAAVGLFELTQNAIADEAGQRRLAVALKNTANATDDQVASIEDWISKQGVALGVADDELRPALQRLVQATGDVGQAQNQLSIAMDVSAGTGKSLKVVTEAMAKANNGSVGALSKLGLKTKDAAGNTLTLDQALGKMSTTFKGQAEANANSLEGKMGRLKLILDETGETIGSKMIPIATKMADWFLRKGLPAISMFGAYLGEKLPPIFEKVKSVVNAVMGAMKGDVGKNVDGVKEIFRNAVSIVTNIWKAFGPTILAYLRSTFENVRTILQGAFDVIRGIFKTVSALLNGDWKGVWNGIKTILRGAWGIIKGLVKQGWNVIKSTFRGAGIAVKAIFKGMWSGIKTLATNGKNALVNGIKAIPGLILGIGPKMLSAGKTLITKFFNGLKKVGSFGIDIGRNLFNGVISGINKAINGINGFLPDKIAIPGAPDINLPDNPLPTIPALAKGGIVSRPTLALIGEAGPEAVVPLRGRGSSILNGGGDGQPLLIQFILDGKVIEQSLIKRERATGRPIQIRTAS